MAGISLARASGWALAFAALALIAAPAARADGLTSEQLASIANNGTQAICELLKAAKGYDVCGSLSPPGPTPPTPAAPGPAGNLCLSYNVTDPPESEAAIIAYLEYALSVDPTSCFNSFVQQCDYTFGSPEEQAESFSSWTENLQVELEFFSGPHDTLIAPTCYDLLSEEQQQSQQTGTIITTLAPGSSDFPDFDGTTPLAVDWAERGFVTPVTRQYGGTCFVHANVNWLASYLLIRQLTDVSGQNRLTNETGLSVQPLLDCVLAKTCCYGGDPRSIAETLQDNGTTTTEQYPYLTGALQDSRANKDDGLCNEPANPQCAAELADPVGLYKAPGPLEFNYYHMSESQLVRYIADNGPVVVSYASGTLDNNWRPLVDGEKRPFSDAFDRSPNASFCSNERNNHAVLATGYDLTNQSAPYLIFKNSWRAISPRTPLGADGFFWAGISPINSPTFTDRSANSTCGINKEVLAFTAPS